MLLRDAPALAEKVREYEDMTPAMFYNLQKTFREYKKSIRDCCCFFALNRFSFFRNNTFWRYVSKTSLIQLSFY